MIMEEFNLKIVSLLVVIFAFSTHLVSDVSDAQKKLLETLPPDQRASILEKMEDQVVLEEEIEEAFEEDQPTLIKRRELKEIDTTSENYCDDCIFGYNYFQFSPTTFLQPTINNTPVSSGYILGPGDKVRVDFYGNEEKKVEATINREGNIILPMLGQVNFLGMRFDQATSYLNQKTKKELIGVEVSMSLKQLRAINVYVVGEAYLPGKYVLSGLSSVSNALFVTGGVNKKGSLRTIQVKRNNKVIKVYDFYDFLLNGSLDSDINLQDGDVIFIPFIENKIKAGGAFKRPYLYEFVEGETVQDAINLAGGFTSEVISKPKIELSYINKDTQLRDIEYLETTEDFNRVLQDGDAINISSNSGIVSESITLTGEVKNPGEYSIQRGDTLLDIINRAGGYTTESFTEGAVFLRKNVAIAQKQAFKRSADELEKAIIDIITKDTIDSITEFTLAPLSSLIKKLRDEEPLGRMVVNVDRLNLKTDPYSNFTVHGGDTLHIPKRPNFVSIVGEVLNSSTMGFDPNLEVNDYLDTAGGLNDSADASKIFIIYPNGQSRLVKRSLFSSKNNLIPGSTIVIPRDSRPFDIINLTQIVTPILADLATSAAAIAALSD